MAEFFRLGESAFGAGAIVDQGILKFDAFLVIGQGRVEGQVPGRKTAVHMGDLVGGNAHGIGQLLGLIRGQFTAIEDIESALEIAQREKQFLLRRHRAQLDHRPRLQNVFGDRRPDPPHGVGREPESQTRVEFLYRFHQSDVAFGNQVGDGKAVAPVFHGDFRHQAQVRRHQLMGSLGVALVTPANGKHLLFFLLQHGKAPHFAEIPRQAAFNGNRR